MSYITDLFYSGVHPAQEIIVSDSSYEDELREKDKSRRELEETLSQEQKILLIDMLRKKNMVSQYERAAAFEYGLSFGIKLVYEALSTAENI